jgi:hypothetical protein
MGGDSTAVRYLRAADATPVTITERDGAAHITIGKIVTDASATYWVHTEQATDLARQTRLLAGDQPSVSRLIAALRETAEARRVVLTPHETAIERAESAVAQLDQLMLQLRESRLLRQFNLRYAQMRRRAKDNNEGFVSYAIALRRLRLASFRS